jgi:HlyD family secretion protein
MISKLDLSHLNSWQQVWQKFVPKGLRSRQLILTLLLVGLLGSFGIYRYSVRAQRQSSQVITTQVSRQSLAVTFSANGTVKAERTINLSPKNAGYLKKLLVKEGDRLRQGQIVAYMDDSNLQGQLLQAQAQLAQQEANLNKLLNGNRPQEIAQSEAQLAEAQAKLAEVTAGNRSQDIDQAQARLSQAQSTLKQAEDDLQRNESLLNEGAIAQQTVVQKRAERDNAQAKVSEAQAALNLQQQGARPEAIAQARSQVAQRQQSLELLQAGTRIEDISAARAQVENAKGSLQNIQTQVNDTMIRAPFDGVVTKKYSDPGSFVAPTTAGSAVEGSSSSSILTLAATNQIVVNLDEAKIPKVKLGQVVIVTADAYPDRKFTGKVSQIAAQATTVQNVTSFEVKIDLESEAQTLLKAGMNVAAEFQIGQLNQAVTVPSSAIVRQENGEAAVYIMTGDRALNLQPIQLGLTVGDRTEVTAGLQGNEQVLLSFPPGMEPKPESTGPFGSSNKRDQ